MTSTTGIIKNLKIWIVFLLIVLTYAVRGTWAAPVSGGAGISISFVGNGTAMGAAELAGVVVESNWNNASGSVRSSPLALLDSTGAATTATVTWSSDNVWGSSIQDQPGNVRMMKGYLDNGNVDTTTVNVAGLPGNSGGYTVYVYAQGASGTATNTGIYQLSGTGIATSSVALTYNSNFSGTFTQATASNANGNYVVFTIPNVTGFQLSAIPSTASNGIERAPVNGIQIVPVGSTTPDFTLSGTAVSSSISAGGSATYTVSTAAVNGFAGAVNLGVTGGLPSGATASFTPTSIAPGASSTLTVATTTNTLAGSFTLSVTGTSGTLTHTTTVPFSVTASGGGGGAVNAIGIDFVGLGTPMGSTEQAGVVLASNWNNASGAVRSTPLALVDSSGAATTAAATWSSDDAWDSSIQDQAGNLRMMKGYLDNGSANTTTVNVSGLPASIGGYNVYVYAQGSISGSTKTGIYQISGTGITTGSVGLTYNSNFSGTFTQATASNAIGNYVVFTLPNVAGFQLSAIPSTASNGNKRAPLNGIQIVPIASGTGGGTGPTISSQPISQSVTAGQTATFSVVAGGTAPLGYQWQKNGATITGATSASYTTPATTTSSNGSTFQVLVNNSTGSITSSAATLTVNSDTTPPAVAITSPSTGATVSGTISVTASASDISGIASVQFQVDGTNSGVANTNSPYNLSLDTTTLSNGSHNLTAVATDTVGNQATSIAVSGTVANQAGSGGATFANNGSACPINTVVGGPTDAVTQYNCPLPNPTGAGNLLVVWLRYHNGNSPAVSFADNIGGNTYTLAKSCTDAGNSGTVSAVYYVNGVKAGVTVVHVNYTASAPFTQMGVYEFYNAGALDSAACQVGSGRTISSGALTFSAINDLVVNFAHNDNNTSTASCSPGSQANVSWIMRSALVISPEPACFQYGVYNATASFAPSMTFATSTSNISVAAAFKAAAGGTAPPGGVRVVYVQHDNGPNHSGAQTQITPQMLLTGNLGLMITIGGCDSNTPASCDYPTGLSDGSNNWTEVSGASFITNTGSQFEEPASIWYAQNARPGLYALAMTMHPCPNNNGCNNFPSNFLIFDITGAAASPLDLSFGGKGNGLATFQSVQTTNGAGGPITSFTASPSFQNELVVAETCYQSNTFTGVTSPSGAQFLTSTYTSETNYTWNDSNCGYALLYNGSSTAAETWTWVHDASQSAGSGRGLAVGAAFQAATP